MDYFKALDINQKVEMLEKICSEERDGYWSKLDFPSVNLGFGAA